MRDDDRYDSDEEMERRFRYFDGEHVGEVQPPPVPPLPVEHDGLSNTTRALLGAKNCQVLGQWQEEDNLRAIGERP